MSDDPTTDRFSDDEMRSMLTEVLVSIRGGALTEDIQRKVEAAIARRSEIEADSDAEIDAEMRVEALVDVVLRASRPALFEGDWRVKPAGSYTVAWTASLEAEAKALVESLLASKAHFDLMAEARRETAQAVAEAVRDAAPRLNAELQHDGREEPGMAAYIQGFGDAYAAALAAAAKYGAVHEQGV